MKKPLRAKCYYVYALIDPRDRLPFYIGKGKDKRCHSHVSQWLRGKGENPDKLARIGEIMRSGHKVVVEIWAADLPEDTAYALEGEHIEDCREKGIPLTNVAGTSRPSAQSGLAKITEAIAKIRRPRQWKWLFLQENGHLPTQADWDVYEAIYKEHIELRDRLRAEMVKVHAAQKAA